MNLTIKFETRIKSAYIYTGIMDYKSFYYIHITSYSKIGTLNPGLLRYLGVEIDQYFSFNFSHFSVLPDVSFIDLCIERVTKLIYEGCLISVYLC